MYNRILLAAVLLASGSAHAALNVNTGSYTYIQNFDSLATAGTANTWTNDSTLAGWSLFNKNSSAITTYRADTGASNTGSFYSYGASASSDRALGGLGSSGAYFGAPASGKLAGYIAVSFQNNTSAALSGFTLNYDGEQWRNGGATAAQTMTVEYGFGSSFSSVSGWTAAGAGFNFTSPVVGTIAGAIDGNAAGRVTNLGATVNTTWNAGDTLWIRMVQLNQVGNDDGLAIDNFSMNAISAVPEADSKSMIFGGLALMGFIDRKSVV